ncbi:peptidoglycan-binding domain-containing protein [Yoonia tamlensis]|uniref:peptidoglycan-binding domain-containing protein n=1 Tax=Yoonia tamlensis TaxID=390270 RepID=UPI001F614C88|nr:peptidoglycan-binding protein [Yoonia tamlensis]
MSATFDRSFPHATGVESFIADVPSAQFPAFWQTGLIDGYQYRLFSNGEGEIKASDPNQDWVVEIACETAGQSCDITVDGDAPTEALQIADTITQCLLSSEITLARTTPENPIVDTTVTSQENVVAPQNSETEIACGVATVNEANDVATMQRLLILLGEDPGPVDGVLGPASFKAMGAFVDDSNWNTSIKNVISALDALHCERSQ